MKYSILFFELPHFELPLPASGVIWLLNLGVDDQEVFPPLNNKGVTQLLLTYITLIVI